MRRYSSGQRGETVNLLDLSYEGSNPSRRTTTLFGCLRASKCEHIEKDPAFAGSFLLPHIGLELLCYNTCMKKVLIIIVALGLVVAFFFPSTKDITQEFNQCIGITRTANDFASGGMYIGTHRVCYGIVLHRSPKIKSLTTNGNTEIFQGIITKVNQGCMADGDCGIYLGEKYVSFGGGMVIDAPQKCGTVNFGSGAYDLPTFIGKKVEAKVGIIPNTSERYSICGDKSYYVKLIPINP